MRGGIILIVDILFTLGMVGFLVSALRQLRKIWRTHKTSGISQTHYKWKFFAVICMTAGYILGNLPISIVVSTTEGVITVTVIYFIHRYRKEEDAKT